MTENQEKEMFKILNRLVVGINEVRGDIVEIKGDIVEIKGDIVDIKRVQREHSVLLGEHSSMLRHLDSKTDAISVQVVENSRRIDQLERESRGRVH
jgi:hypothetical protein